MPDIITNLAFGVWTQYYDREPGWGGGPRGSHFDSREGACRECGVGGGLDRYEDEIECHACHAVYESKRIL